MHEIAVPGVIVGSQSLLERRANRPEEIRVVENEEPLVRIANERAPTNFVDTGQKRATGAKLAETDREDLEKGLSDIDGHSARGRDLVCRERPLHVVARA
jgi:hypothetical protein